MATGADVIGTPGARLNGYHRLLFPL